MCFQLELPRNLYMLAEEAIKDGTRKKEGTQTMEIRKNAKQTTQFNIALTAHVKCARSELHLALTQQI